MAYMGSEAYDFSLFEPKVIEQPKKTNASGKNTVRRSVSAGNTAPQRRVAPERRPEIKKNNVVRLANEHQQTVERKSSSAVVSAAAKKAIAFACFCFSLVIALLVLQTKNDMVDAEIAQVNNEIAIAEGEAVRLNAELNSLIASDKIDIYAQDVLGMVKAESHQISYIDRSEDDEIVVSGDKSTAEEETVWYGKLESLFAYND